MVVWDVLDAQFDDETRQAKDLSNLNSVFEVVKLAVLEPDEPVVQLQKLSGSSYKGLIAVSVGTTVVVFGEDGTSLLLQLTLKNCIDTLIWLPCGEFLLLADRLGYLHCIHMESKALIFSKSIPVKLEEENCTFISGLSYLEHNKEAVVVLVTKLGQIVTISDIDTKSLCNGIMSKDVALLTAVESQLSVKVEDVFDFDVTFTCACFYVEQEIPRAKLWIKTDEGIISWVSHASHSSQSDNFLLSSLTDCTKLVILQKGRYLAALDHEGQISVYCTETGILLWEVTSDIFKEHGILDFHELSSDNKCSQLLTLVSSSSDTPSYFLCLTSFPGFFLKHELSVSKDTYLIKLGDGTENSLFIEGKRNLDGSIESLNLKNIVDGNPETRLEKLLRNGKFEEAETFCGTFNLDVSEVYKANAKYLCNIISPWRSSNVMENQENSVSRFFEDLLGILGKVMDLEYVTTICSEAPMPDIIHTRRLLAYGKQRIAKDIKTHSDDNLKSLMHKISENLYNLSTYQMIYSDSNVHQWFEFSHANMLNEFFGHLVKGHLDIARTIWHRHQYKFWDKMNNSCVEKILNSIPCNFSSDVIFHWLQNHILKDVLRLCPASIEVIAFWIDRKLKTIEFHEKELWPTNALNLAQNVISILNNTSFSAEDIDVHMTLYPVHEKAHCPNSSLYQLRMTVLALEDLKVLTDKFRLKMKFSQYTQESKYLVVKSLMDMLVCGEEVAPLFGSFLRDYMRRHDLKCDRTMAQYITDTLSSYGQAWWMWDQAPWENKLYAVIHVISGAEVKAECILQCIQAASVPWNRGTIEICDVGIALNTQLKSQLESQSKLSNLKLVLRKYHIHNMNFTDGKIFELILRSICQKEDDKSIADALIVVDAFCGLKKNDAYFFKFCYFTRVGKFEEGVSLFKAIESDIDKLDVFLRFQNYVIQQLNVPPITVKCKTKLNMYTSGILLVAPIIMSCLKTTQLTELDDIRRLNILQKFDIYLSIAELEQNTVCTEFLKDFILRTYQKRQLRKIDSDNLKDSSSPDFSVSQLSHVTASNRNDNSYEEGQETCLFRDLQKVLRVSQLLGFPKEDLFTFLFSMVSSKGESKIAMEFANVLTDDTKVHKCISVIYDIVEKIANFWMTADLKANEDDCLLNLTGQQMKKLYNLITSALPLCSIEILPQLTNMALWCFFGIELFNRCLLSKDYNRNKASLGDSSFDFSFTSLFKDVSVPIEPHYVIAVISNILLVCCKTYNAGMSKPFIKNEEINFSAHEDIMYTLTELGCHLQDRNQDLIYVSLWLTLSSHQFSLICNLNTVSDILHKRILSKKQDMAYTLSLLTVLKAKDSLKVVNGVIKKIGNDHSYLLTFANVGIDLCKLLRLKEVCAQFIVLATSARWGLKFENLGLSFPSYFSEEEIALNRGLNDLAQHKDCDLEILAEFSRDFNWDIIDAYLCYLKACIHRWSPTFREDGSEEVLTPPNELILKCQTIIFKIYDKSRLKQMLNEELVGMCPYNYEVAEILISQICILESVHNDMLKTGRDVLCFLKTYERHNQPSSYELEEYLNAHPERRELPKIANYRLPFHLLYCKPFLNKLIKHEVNSRNCEQWIGISSFLMLNIDQIYFFAAQNLLSHVSEKKCHLTKRAWQIGSSNSSTLATIQELIWKIQHSELAMACGNWVVQNLPYSLDKVVAVQNCIKLAAFWMENSSSNKAKEAFDKFSSMYRKLAIEYSLYKYNLAEPELISLTNDPCYLVSKLYENSKLSSLTVLSTQAIPDINNCVTEICDASGEHKVAHQMKLLQKWLPLSTNQNDGIDESISNFKLAVRSNVMFEESQNKEERLSRAIYLLRNYPKEEAIIYLLSLAFCTLSSPCIDNRLISLRCLLAIADEEAIMKHSHKSIEEIRLMLQSLTYVSRLEEVGYAMTLTQFDSIDKTALVEGLWHTLKHVPKALMLMVDMCLNFKVNSTRLWGVLLDQITKCVEDKSLDESSLQRVLLQIKLLPHLWVLPQLTTAWSRLLTGILSSVSIPVRGDDLDSCVHAVNLLTYHCPVEVSTENLIETCLLLELPVLAAVIAASEHTQNKSIEDIFNKFDRDAILSNYENVEKTLMIPKNIEIYFTKWKGPS